MIKNYRKTKILATIGPSSEKLLKLKNLFQAESMLLGLIVLIQQDLNLKIISKILGK